MAEFESVVGNLVMDDMSVVVEDPDGIAPPHTIIQVEDKWKVTVTWKMSGPCSALGGQWEVNLYYEGLGGGADGEFANSPQIVPLDGGCEYEAVFDFNPNPLPVGSYRLVTVLSHRNFGALQETQAISEGPIIRIYEHD